MKKLNRNYYLEVDTSDGTIVTIKTPLTLEFSVIRNVLASASTANFTIYNLSGDTRSQILKDKYATNIYRGVRLHAGYGEVMPLIFDGNIREAQSTRDGVNVMTIIDAYDGAFAMQNSFTSKTLKEGMGVVDVIKGLARDLIVQDKEPVIGKFEGVFSRGLALFGPTWEQIKTYTNGQCYFDNSQFFAIEIRNGEVVGDNGIPVINAETGLVGSPRRAEGVIEVEMLFEPRLVIGQAVKLESKINPIFNGIYVVSGLEHRGTISPVTAGQCITGASLWSGERKFGDPIGYADAS